MKKTALPAYILYLIAGEWGENEKKEPTAKVEFLFLLFQYIQYFLFYSLFSAFLFYSLFSALQFYSLFSVFQFPCFTVFSIFRFLSCFSVVFGLLPTDGLTD